MSREEIRFVATYIVWSLFSLTAVSSEAWAKLREWAILAGKGRLLLSGSVVLASLKATVCTLYVILFRNAHYVDINCTFQIFRCYDVSGGECCVSSAR